MPENLEEAEVLEEFLTYNYMETLGFLPALTILLLLSAIVYIDRYIGADMKRTIRLIILTLFSLIVQNYLEYRLADGVRRSMFRTLVSIYGYSIRPVLLILFLRVIAPKKRFFWLWLMAGGNAAAYGTALFSRISFWFDDLNHFQRGPLSFLCLYFSILLMVYGLVLTIQNFVPQGRKDLCVPILVLLVIIGAIVLDGNVGAVEQPISFLTIASIIGCMTYFIWLHMRFVWEHEEALIAGQRVQLMLSQIKPHFLFNTLNVISSMCDKEPQQVKPAIHLFAHYLQGNMNSIDQNGPIPFTKELEHTKAYLDIERMRFGDALKVSFDINYTNFHIPALTLEPLVENAVRHGVRKNKGGQGTVMISTRDARDHSEVVVTDDGPGFDPSRIYDDNKRHIGLINVRERLAVVCNGRLDIQSAPGKGTKVTIIVPKEQETKEC